MGTGPLEDPLVTVVDLVTSVAEACGDADDRLEAIVDLLTSRLSSTVGLMVHGAPAGYDVRVVGRAGAPGIRRRMSDGMRITGGPDPLVDRFRLGNLEPTTAERAHGGQVVWQASPKCIGSIEMWGINQVAALPVRPGEEFVVFFVGRHGADYEDRDLELLRAVQPVVAGFVRMLEPERLAPARMRVDRLTTRETQVLALLAAGHKAATIARLAGCSHRTVHRHLSNIYGKLGVGDRLSAVTTAQSLGLLEELGPPAQRRSALDVI